MITLRGKVSEHYGVIVLYGSLPVGAVVIRFRVPHKNVDEFIISSGMAATRYRMGLYYVLLKLYFYYIDVFFI